MTHAAGNCSATGCSWPIWSCAFLCGEHVASTRVRTTATRRVRLRGWRRRVVTRFSRAGCEGSTSVGAAAQPDQQYRVRHSCECRRPAVRSERGASARRTDAGVVELISASAPDSDSIPDESHAERGVRRAAPPEDYGGTAWERGVMGCIRSRTAIHRSRFQLTEAASRFGPATSLHFASRFIPCSRTRHVAD